MFSIAVQWPSVAKHTLNDVRTQMHQHSCNTSFCSTLLVGMELARALKHTHTHTPPPLSHASHSSHDARLYIVWKWNAMHTSNWNVSGYILSSQLHLLSDYIKANTSQSRGIRSLVGIRCEHKNAVYAFCDEPSRGESMRRWGGFVTGWLWLLVLRFSFTSFWRIGHFSQYSFACCFSFFISFLSRHESISVLLLRLDFIDPRSPGFILVHFGSFVLSFFHSLTHPSLSW